MTNERMALLDLVEKEADSDLVREMLAFAAERMMEAEAEVAAGAAKGARTPLREAHRNGYRARELGYPCRADRAGDPAAAQGLLLPELPGAPTDGGEGAGGGDPGGLRARRLDPLGRRPGEGDGRGRHVEEPGVAAVRRDRHRVNAFLSRPLEGAWPYLWLDATYIKVREGGRIISRAVIVAVAVNSDGKREVLGIATGPSEAETFWTDFLRSLADRGLRGIKLVIADDHKGLRAAPGASSMPACNGAACIGCAMRSPMPRPSSVLPSPPC